MSVASRQNKQRKDGAHAQPSSPVPRRGGGPSSGGAWRGAHNSPSIMHSPSTTRTASATQSGRNTPQQQIPQTNTSTDPFPPITASAKPQQSQSQQVSSPTSLPQSNLAGSIVVVTTLTGSRYQGLLLPNDSNTPPGVSLKDAKDLVNVGASVKPNLFIPSQDVANWKLPDNLTSPSNGINSLDSFRTDADIGAGNNSRMQRELQAWKPDAGLTNSVPGEYDRDAQTFGGGHVNGSWDQFAANEHLFGVTTDFNEELYTTKLDRSAADFKEKERKAQQLANEIISATSSNPHVREERQGFDDSGLNEEDKYGAVVRGANAYVPPGARRQDGSGSLVTKPTTSSSSTTVPKVSVNGPDGAVGGLPGLAAKVATQAPLSTNPADAPLTKPGDGGVIASFREFVSTEKQKLVQKKQAIAKSEKDKRIADLIQFGATFKLNKPIPADLVPILAKDEDKQKSILERSAKDAADVKARTIGVPTQISPLPGTASTATNTAATAVSPSTTPKNIGSGLTPSNMPYKPSAIPQIPAFRGGKVATNSNKVASGTSSAKPTSSGSNTLPADVQSKREPIVMSIQKIPPFDASKRRTMVTGNDSKSSVGPVTNGQTNGQPPSSPTGSTSSSAQNAFKLNVNASSFRPNPGASSFKAAPPTPSSQLSSSSPNTKPAETPQPPHPFFGPRPFKNRAAVHIKDDFNPFKITKVVGASSVSQNWPFHGKKVMPPFSPPAHPHVAPQPPPPPYEDDPAIQQAQAQAARANAPAYGMVFYPYQYPGQPPQQHMMVAPTGPPPAGYMPPQFMPAMPYPPHMPPNAGPGMYGPPPMGPMPPNPAYMQPPPQQGAYPPPNGGPRGSISPAPLPQHPYAYHHQSPQMAHSHQVPYQMMMPPPGSAHPHAYEGQPPGPGPMGVGH